MDSKPHKRVMTGYLLGELSPQERADLEEQYAVDSDLFEELVAVEHDLVDSYASGALTALERKQFENYYLKTAQRRKRAEFAESLRSYALTPDAMELARESSKATASVWQSPAAFLEMRAGIMQTAAAIVFMLLAAGALWIVSVNLSLRRELAELQTEQATLKRTEQQLQQRINQLSSAQSETSAAVREGETVVPETMAALLTLNPGLRSGDQQNVVALSPAARSARLRLKLDRRDYLAYGAKLETAEGATVWQKQGLKRQISNTHLKFLIVELPSNVLLEGDYILRITGATNSKNVEEVDAYSFRVVRP
jgi:hypothetical protein